MVAPRPPGKRLKVAKTTTTSRPKIIPKITIKKGSLEDDEEAPVEEQFILRMPAGEEADKLRDAVSTREIPEDFSLVFQDPRRATLSLGPQKYSAKLVDLPCILESHKTFDNKQLYKITDISQMLVVEDQPQPTPYVPPTTPLHHDEYTWPHGISAPLWNVRKRRFRTRISKRTIEDVEREVMRLLEADAEAEHVWFEIDDGTDRNVPGGEEEEEDGEGSAEEEEATASVSNMGVDEEDDALAAAWEDTFADEEENVEEENDEDEDEEDDRSDDDEDEEDSDGPGDESGMQSQASAAQVEMQQQIDNLSTEIAELEARVDDNRAKLSVQINPIMITRFQDIVSRLTTQVDAKREELAEAQAAFTS
ncbi:hypothetical protein HKX48_004491 [Thoreauomyces humboldtii]|nr:hypothetical protein HKX48_004491 [Thoreauomyces humboldtii]